MENIGFEELKEQFKHGDVDTKIGIYMSADGLTQPQYKELLRMFPLDELNKLELALSEV